MHKDNQKQVLRLVRSAAGWMGRRVGQACFAGYRFCYGTGVQTIRFMKYTGRRLKKWLAPVGRLVYKAADFVLLRHLWALGRECRRIGQGFCLAVGRLKAAWKRHPLLVIPQTLVLPWLAVRRHRKAVASLFNLAAPVAAAFVLVGTIQYWSNLTFALALEYDGEKLGVIATESVFDTAVNMATERVINTDNSFEVQRQPKMTITLAQKEDMLDERAVCDKILKNTENIAEVSGLYVNGVFEGAVVSRSDLEAVLHEIKSHHLTGEEEERAEFIQDVEIVDGLYPLSSLLTLDEMSEKLNAQTVTAAYYTAVKGDTLGRIAGKNNMTLNELKAMNPEAGELVHIGDQFLVQRPQAYLKVQVVRTLRYTEDIAFEVERQTDSAKYTTYEKVLTKGKKGSRDVVAEAVYINGEEESRTILSSVVTKEPVTQVVVVGTKKQLASSGNEVVQGDGISTGKFAWPLPVCTNVHQKYHSGHRAWDISSGPVPVFNQKVVAVDGGKVITASRGNNGGYGNLVVIEHAGGLTTVYAHLNSIDVVVGQKVSRGQTIGRAGNSGRSFGPHLHFEVRKQGVKVNPINYLTPGSYR